MYYNFIIATNCLIVYCGYITLNTIVNSRTMYLYVDVYTNFVYMNAFLLGYVSMYLYIMHMYVRMYLYMCIYIYGPLNVCICMSICYDNVTTVKTRYRTASQSGPPRIRTTFSQSQFFGNSKIVSSDSKSGPTRDSGHGPLFFSPKS